MPKTQIVDDQQPKQKSHYCFSLYLVKARPVSLYKGKGREDHSGKIVGLGNAKLFHLGV